MESQPQKKRKNLLHDIIKTNFKCVICQDYLCRSITLLCQHTFCEGCLVNLNERKCPVCNIPFILPPSNIHNCAIDNTIEELKGKKFITRKAEDSHRILKLELEDIVRQEIKDEIWSQIAGDEIQKFYRENNVNNCPNRIVPNIDRIVPNIDRIVPNIDRIGIVPHNDPSTFEVDLRNFPHPYFQQQRPYRPSFISSVRGVVMSRRFTEAIGAIAIFSFAMRYTIRVIHNVFPTSRMFIPLMKFKWEQ